MLFYMDSNNGVMGVVSEAVYREMNKRRKLLRECEAAGLPMPQLPPVVPVFTFSNPSHPAFRFMTGSKELLEKLLVGHEVAHGGIWVPFSNGSQWKGGDEEKMELLYRTNLDEAIEAFGLIVSPTQSA
jgi:hypothetical protein